MNNRCPLFAEITDNKSLHPIWPPVKDFARCSRGEAKSLPGFQTGELNRYVGPMKSIARLMLFLMLLSLLSGCMTDANEHSLFYTDIEAESFIPLAKELNASLKSRTIEAPKSDAEILLLIGIDQNRLKYLRWDIGNTFKSYEYQISPSYNVSVGSLYLGYSDRPTTQVHIYSNKQLRRK